MYIKNLRHYRRKRELTVQQVADKLGLSRFAYNQIEQNNFTINESYGNAIVHILNIPASSIIKITPEFLFQKDVPLEEICAATELSDTDIEKFQKMHPTLLLPIKAKQAVALLSYLKYI